MTDTDPLLAEIIWSDKGLPKSALFDEFYNSETIPTDTDIPALFLQPNDLPRRWATLPPNGTFTIGETGFGLGLNFLSAWQLWLQYAPATARLHFISSEKYPLTKRDLARAQKQWPHLQPLAQLLQAAYPALLAKGIHPLQFQNGNVTLSLIVGDANAGFSSLRLEGCRDRAVDAWILDGFAAHKNPDIWSPVLAQTLAALSKPNATLATRIGDDTIVGNFSAAGFELHKSLQPGLRGILTAVQPSVFSTTPWHLPDSGKNPSNHCHQVAESTTTIAIIGAGIAGCAQARALAERGLQVTVFEQGSQPASGASGNAQGILYAKLSSKPSPNGDFNLHALQFALRYYRQHCPQAMHFCGQLQLAQKPTDLHRQQQLAARLEQLQAGALARAVDTPEASRIAGLPLQLGGLFFPGSGWLEPGSVCAELLRHKNIQLHCNTSVTQLEFTDRQWQLHTLATDLAADQVQSPHKLFSADSVILCTANGLKDVAQTNPLPLQPIRGQVSAAPASVLSQTLKTVLCGEGYITPAHRQQHSFGATFKLKDQQTEIRASEHRQNLSTLAQLLPEIATEFSTHRLHGRAAVRAATPDYLPLAGPVPQWDSLQQTYIPLAKNRKLLIPQTAAYWPRLFVLAGLGSRGFTYAPLAAEVVAAWVCDELLPVSNQLAKALHPARFMVRALAKKQTEK